MSPNDRKPSDPDSFGVGMLADGTLPVFSPAEYASRIAERNAEEAALDAEDDDLSDLDDIGDLP